jgi:signal peptidase II
MTLLKAGPRSLPKARWFWPVFATILLADCSSKELVVSVLTANPGPHSLVGDLLRVTLAYNADAAFSLSFGSASRLVFSVLACVALAVLFRLYYRTRPDGVLRAVAIGLVAGGALGNLLDRLRSARGVVDFIDVGMGQTRFWTFNLADLGVTVGALLLAAVLWREDRGRENAA